MTFSDFSSRFYMSFRFFFFNDTATTEIYTLSLHDALPILPHRLDGLRVPGHKRPGSEVDAEAVGVGVQEDRKSTRLNSSHDQSSYAVFCLKKKNSDCKNHSSRLPPPTLGFTARTRSCQHPS